MRANVRTLFVNSLNLAVRKLCQNRICLGRRKLLFE